MSEGYIKFNCTWDEGVVQFDEGTYLQLEKARAQLYALGLIGIYPDGIGFGNISVRGEKEKSFIISGSATGGLTRLMPSDYALVTKYDIEKNTVFCRGIVKASSESLTHAAIYQSVSNAGAVVHVHHLELWEKLLGKLPTTDADIEYGTPEMARAVGQLAFDIKDHEEKIIIMGGHPEGILIFDETISHATQQIIQLYERIQHA